jgi:hypothetical protein
MKNKGVWVLAGVAALVLLIVGITQLPAQRAGGGVIIGGPPVGRFVVALVEKDTGGTNHIILLDTATGELYKATDEDIKKFADKPKFDRPPMRPVDKFRDKDKGRFDKDKDVFDKDKGRFDKDKGRFGKDKD